MFRDFLVFHFQYIKTRLTFIVWSSGAYFSEFINGLTIAAWGLFLIDPFQQTFISSELYVRFLIVPLPEAIQGFLIAAIGVTSLFSLMYGRYCLRKWITFVIFVFWVYVSSFFMLENLAATSSVIYPLLALQALWVYVRIIMEPWKYHKS